MLASNGSESTAGLNLDLDLIIECPLPPELEVERLRDLSTFVLGREGASGSWTLAVVLSDDERLGRLHREFMGLDTATDVMTFPADGGTDGASGGDIVVSVERAAEQAAEFGQTPADEVRFLVVHGLLHLCGWDDGTVEQRVRMLERQAELLREFDRAEGDAWRR